MNYFWILDILVLIVLVLCLLGGLISGFLKSFRKLLALLIPTILLFIFLTPMTNAVMNFKVDLKAIDQQKPWAEKMAELDVKYRQWRNSISDSL